ncbi:ATP-grasp domain-containing protein, partial [Azospirillum isscasi]
MPMMPPAGSPAERPAGTPDIIVAALSARALAAAARRGGLRPAAIDLFADLDTRRLAEPCLRLPSGALRLDSGALLGTLARAELRGLPLVYGAGFEDDPALLARIADDRPLLGNRAEVVARVKDPFLFAAALDRLGIPHPPVARVLDAPPGDYLLKRTGGSGGGHIAPAAAAEAPPGWYLQRRIAGHAVSVLFLADGDRAVIVGPSRQWTAPTPDNPYRYGGAAGPWRCPERLTRTLPGLMSRLAAAFGLVGLNSADFLLSRSGHHLLEINPRPGATLDVFDRPPMPPLFGLHLDACAGRLPDRLPALQGCRAAEVLYADAPTRIVAGTRWP